MRTIQKLKDAYIKNKEICIIILLSFILIIPYLQSKTFVTDDKTFHLLRIQGIKESFENGIYFPRIYQSVLYDYGYANPLFYPDIFLYIPAILFYCGVNLSISYDIFIFLVNISTGVISYYSFNKITSNKKAIWLTFLYLYFPYRLINLYIRNATGEILAFMFIPLLFLFIYKFIKENKCDWILLTIAFTGLINSHIISLYICFLVLAIICLLRIKVILTKSKVLINFIKAVLTTIIINAYFLFPLLEQIISQKFKFNEGSVWSDTKNNAIVLSKNMNLKLAVALFFVLTLILIAFLYFSKFYKDKEILTLFIISFVIIILTTNITPWHILNKIPLLENIQFAWRLYIISSITIPLLILRIGEYLYNRFNEIKMISKNIKIALKIFVYIVWILIIFYMCTWQPVSRNFIVHSSTVVGGEYLPIEFNYSYLINNIDYCGNGKEEYSFKRINYNNYINSNNKTINSNIEVPLIYYKGYTLYEGNEVSKKADLKKSCNGLIEIDIKESIKEELIIKYSGTDIQKYSYILSLIGINIFAFIIIKRKRLA